MAEDLSAALRKIFFGPVAGLPQKTSTTGTTTTGTATTPSTEPATALTIKQLADSAMEHYKKALDAQKRGDWATYGEEIKLLEEILKKMQTAYSA